MPYSHGAAQAGFGIGQLRGGGRAGRLGGPIQVADALAYAAYARLSQRREMVERRQRRPLPAHGHIGRAEVPHHGHLQSGRHLQCPASPQRIDIVDHIRARLPGGERFGGRVDARHHGHAVAVAQRNHRRAEGGRHDEARARQELAKQVIANPERHTARVAVLLLVLAGMFMDFAGLRYTHLLVLLAFFVWTTRVAARQVLFTGSIDLNKIIGAICIYLLLGLIWALLYLFIAELSPSAFNGFEQAPWTENFFSAIYYSFVTLTTLGYGEITPALPIARFLAFMEAIVRPVTWAEWPEAATQIFQGFRSPAGEDMVIDKNLFVEAVLPGSIIRELSQEEHDEYRRVDGQWLLEPQIEKEGVWCVDLDIAMVAGERQNFDPAGHYSRPDVTRLKVNRKRQKTVGFKD